MATLIFSAEKFYEDMGRGPRPYDWVLKHDGRPVVDVGKVQGNARIKGTGFWVPMEWLELVE